MANQYMHSSKLLLTSCQCFEKLTAGNHIFRTGHQWATHHVFHNNNNNSNNYYYYYFYYLMTCKERDFHLDDQLRYDSKRHHS